MTINQRFLEEARQLEQLWARNPAVQNALSRIDHPFTRSTVAVLLENQRQMNERGPVPDDRPFQRLQIPLFRRQPDLRYNLFRKTPSERVNWLQEGF